MQRPTTVSNGGVRNDSANLILLHLFANGFWDRSENVITALLPCQCRGDYSCHHERVSVQNGGAGCQLINGGKSWLCSVILRTFHVNSFMLWRKSVRLGGGGNARTCIFIIVMRRVCYTYRGHFKENKQLFSNVISFVPRNITPSSIIPVIISDALVLCREFEWFSRFFRYVIIRVSVLL